MLYIGVYYADILALNRWDNLTNLLNMDYETLVFYGRRAEKYAEIQTKQLERG